MVDHCVQIAALTARNQELAARAEVAEAQTAALTSRLERMKATTSIDTALQAFRRHLGGVPAEVDTSLFYEREEDVIGKGGCGKVSCALDLLVDMVTVPFITVRDPENARRSL
jgi:hypothetical protein